MLPIETSRLVLRSFQIEDVRAVHAYLSDPDVMRYVPEQPFTLEETERFVTGSASGPDGWVGLPDKLAILLKPSFRVIGHLVFASFHGVFLTYEIGWVIHRRYQGQGYATEAAEAVLELGFREMSLHRVVATCDPRNTASWRVMEKLGMRCEAHQLRSIFKEGEWLDEYQYAILAHEWSARSQPSSREDYRRRYPEPFA